MSERGINKVMLIGNMCNDPEIKQITHDVWVANIVIATNESWKDRKTGALQNKTEYHRISVYGRAAEVVRDYVRKGDLLYVEGKLETKKWNDAHGNPRRSLDIVVQGYSGKIQIFGGRKEQSQPTNGMNEPQANQGVSQDGFFNDDIPF